MIQPKVVKQLGSFEEKMIYLKDILTPQEHKLIGSNHSFNYNSHSSDLNSIEYILPHVPSFIQEEMKNDIKNCVFSEKNYVQILKNKYDSLAKLINKLRKEKNELTAFGICGFYKIKGIEGTISLAPIQTDIDSENFGHTFYDPVLIAYEKDDGCETQIFPFARDGAKILKDKKK